MKNQTLENKLQAMIPSSWQTVKVVAFELTHDGDSWSVNTPFCLASSTDRETAISILRSRWNVFKANYLKNARVMDISDMSCEENICNLECDCVAFADVSPTA